MNAVQQTRAPTLARRKGVWTALLGFVLLELVLLSCGSRETPTPRDVEVKVQEPQPVEQPRLISLVAESQREGNAESGYRALVGENYVGCGVPQSLVQRFFGTPSQRWQLPGRPASSEGLPYFLNGYTTADGTKMATANCLSCHASMLQGKLVVGLGETRVDYSADATMPLQLASLVPATGEAGVELRKLVQRAKAIAPYIRTKVAGPNPADSVAAALFAHRDPKTLAWSKDLLLQEPSKDVPPVDVPAWWHLKKKNAMFYTGAGRGDQARIMMTSSALCTDSVERARAIDAYFPDVRAYVLSLEAPAYAFPIDEEKASAGQKLFRARCARCHGTYGPASTYPNLLVHLDEVGTDPYLALGSAQFAAPYLEWFAQSFYGEISRLEPGHGYVAPPLDGIWATAPYLHNGSVPTVAMVLDSTVRPAAWVDTRSRSAYLEDALGFPFAIANDEDKRQSQNRVYDTSIPGYSSSGHTYGDSMSASERAAILEYLKTL